MAKDLTHEVGKVPPPGADGGNEGGHIDATQGVDDVVPASFSSMNVELSEKSDDISNCGVGAKLLKDGSGSAVSYSDSCSVSPPRARKVAAAKPDQDSQQLSGQRIYKFKTFDVKRQETLVSLMNLMGSLKFLQLQLAKFDSEHDSLLPLQRLAVGEKL